MSDAVVTYEKVIVGFIFLAGLLLIMRYKTHKKRDTGISNAQSN